MPKIFCKCGLIKTDGKCPKCRWKPYQKDIKQKAYNSKEWKATSVFHRTRWPLCVHCERDGITTSIAPGDKSGVVDHIVPFNTFNDSGFLDTYNHQGLCVDCHAKKSRMEYDGKYTEELIKRDLQERKAVLMDEFPEDKEVYAQEEQARDDHDDQMRPLDYLDYQGY